MNDHDEYLTEGEDQPPDLVELGPITSIDLEAIRAGWAAGHAAGLAEGRSEREALADQERPAGSGPVPSTPSGQALDDWAESDARPLQEFGPWDAVYDAIIAIEAEARLMGRSEREALDVERLALAMETVHAPTGLLTDFAALARAYAAEYNRLAAHPTPPDSIDDTQREAGR